MLARKLKKTFVLVTHDMLEAVRLAERVIVLAEGRIIQDAPPAEIVRNPAHPVVEALLGRHRYQLELMTKSLAAALEAHGAGTLAQGSILELSEDTSVWQALALMSSSRAGAVRVRSARGERVLSREQLL